MNEIDQELIEYLKTQTQKEWHQTAMSWNWDSDLDVLEWMASNEKCDKGTALLMYWYSGPGWTHQYLTSEEAPYNKRVVKLNQLIEDNYLSGFYKKEEISFDPKNDRGTDWTKEYADLPQKREIPKIMFTPTNGVVVELSKALIEGYPTELFNKYY